MIRHGLPVSAVDKLMDTFGLAPDEVDRVIMPRKTFSHRRTLGNLTPLQSERVLRVARVLTFALETHGITA